METGIWLEAATATGTIGAALFAGYAALVARRAANASWDLASLERARYNEEAEEAKWKQARRVTVDVGSSSLTDSIGSPVGLDVFARVTNASPDPLFKVRVMVVAGGTRWGPQLMGTLAPGHDLDLMARLQTPHDTEDLNAFVRFVDVQGQAWVANARSMVEPDDDENLARWIQDGREFAQRALTPHERGTVSGARPPMPDFEGWRQAISEMVD